jgi:hypothetical protein
VQSDLSRCDEVNSENDAHARNGADESKNFRGAAHCILEPPGQRSDVFSLWEFHRVSSTLYASKGNWLPLSVIRSINQAPRTGGRLNVGCLVADAAKTFVSACYERFAHALIGNSTNRVLASDLRTLFARSE